MTHKMWTALAAFSVTIGVAAGIASAASVTMLHRLGTFLG